MRVVDIKTLSILLGLFLVLLVVPWVSALDRSDSVGDNSFPFNESFLIITDVDVQVGAKLDKNLMHGDDIAAEAKPGDIVEFAIEVANIFTPDDDVEIEDIEVEITIENIDDGDDLDADDEFDDLDPGDDDSIRITLDIPLEVHEDTFDVLIEVEGDTNFNGTHEARMELTLEVKKEDHEIRFLKAELSNQNINCGDSTTLDLRVINIGADAEENVVLEITNVDLGVNFREMFDLSDDPFDDDSKFGKTFTFTVPNNIPVGIYTILAEVIYNNGGNIEIESVDLVIVECIPQLLKISDLDVKVNGKTDKNIEDKEDGYRISDEADPGSNLKFTIKVANLYTDEEDIKIENIDVIVTIEGIDDDDDLEEESNEFDLKPEDDKKVTLDFDIPLKVDDGDYDVIIKVEGRDETGITHRIEKKFELEVKKENHELSIIKANLNPSEVSCDRNARLDVEILNLGEDEEDEVKLEIINSELGVNNVEENIELGTGVGDDASYRKSISLSIDDEIDSGFYPVLINAYYDFSKLSHSKTVDLVIQDCEKIEEIKEEKPTEKCDGCFSMGKCVPKGTSGLRNSIEEVYCDGIDWIPKKGLNEICEFNFECKIYSCVDSICKVKEQIQIRVEPKNIFYRSFAWFKILFG